MVRKRYSIRTSLSKEDIYLCSAALVGLVSLLLLVTAIPSGQLTFASLFGRLGSFATTGGALLGDATHGVFNYGQSLVALNQQGAYLRFDMSLEYESSQGGNDTVLTPARREAAASMFESLRGKIDDAIISEMSRRGAEEISSPDAVGELKDDLAYSINEKLRTGDVLISNVYFTSFLLIPPDTESEPQASAE